MIFRVIAVLLVVMSIASCSDTVTYAEQLKAEKELIADYIARNNIKVVTTEPKEWGDNVYYLTDSGLYFHLISPGDSASHDTIAENDLVVPRFYQYTLDVVADTVANWNTVDYPYPTTFNYGDDTQACTGWQDAVSLMMYNGARAKFIVKSKLGFDKDSESVIPYVYDMKIKFQR